MSFYDFSAIPASNTTVGGIGSAGSSSANLIDDLIRELAASGRQFLNDIGGANTVGGTANAITITPSSGTITAAADGMVIWFIASATNTSTSVTAAVGGLTAEPVKKFENGAESVVAVGDIRSGGFYGLRWRASWDSAGGAWELIDPYKGELYIPSSATASTSGTEIDFTISTSAKRVTLMLNAVSTSGTNTILVQVGSGAVYSGTMWTDSASVRRTDGFPVFNPILAGNNACGLITLMRQSGDIWMQSGSLVYGNTASTGWSSGGIIQSAPSGNQTRVRVTTIGGTDTFDAGSINIAVE